MLGKLGPGKVLQLFDKGVAGFATADDKGLYDQPACGIWRADYSAFLHIGMFQQSVFNFNGRHGPARRNDDIIGATAMVKIAVFVDLRHVLGRQPSATAPEHEFTHFTRFCSRAAGHLHFKALARHCFSERARFYSKIGRAGIIDQNHANLGRSVHRTGGRFESAVDKVERRAINRLAGVAQLFEVEGVIARNACILHHAVMGRGSGHVGDLIIRKRLYQPDGIKAPGKSARRHAKAKRCQRAMPQSVPPSGRRRAEKFVTRANASAIKCGKHQRDERFVGVLDRFGQFARGAAGILIHGHIAGFGFGRVMGWEMRDLIEQAIVSNDDLWPVHGPRHFSLFSVGDQDAGLTIIDAQAQRIGSKQREQWHRDRAGLHRAEKTDIEWQRRFKHEGDTLAGFHALPIKPMRELGSTARNSVKAEDFIGALAVRNPHRRATIALGMAGDRLMRDVELVAVAVKQVPQCIHRGMRLRIGIACEFGESWHDGGLSHKGLAIVNSEWYSIYRMTTPSKAPAIARAAAILRLLGKSETPLGVNSIARELGLVPSTCLYVLRALAEEQLVSFDTDTKRYALEAGVLTLARQWLRRNQFSDLAQPALDRLAQSHNVSMLGVQIVGLDHIIAVAVSRSGSNFQVGTQLGSRFPALISATGRCIAAFGDYSDATLEARFHTLRWDDPPTFADWKDQVRQTREQGYGVDDGNYISGVTVVAAPVWKAAGRPSHALVAIGIGGALKGEELPKLAEALLANAHALTSQIGG